MAQRRLALAFFLFLAVGCNQGLVDSRSDLVVINDSPCDITVLVDGREVFTVESSSDRALDHLDEGRHVVEVLDSRQRLLERRAMELAPGEDFYLIIDNC